MNLGTADWKTAWLEKGISDRFFQEMTRLERHRIPQLRTSGQWTAQLMADLGSLAGHALKLDQETVEDVDLQQGYNKAIALAALAAQCAMAFNMVMNGQGALPRHPLPRVQPPLPPNVEHAPAPETPGSTVSQAPGGSGMELPFRTPRPMAGINGAALKTVEAAGQELPQGPAGQTNAAADGEETPHPVSSVLANPANAESPVKHAPMRHTILSLSRRGLSRGEIEVITGQSLEKIEQVLKAG